MNSRARCEEQGKRGTFERGLGFFSGLQNAHIARDGFCGEFVVSGDHEDADTGLLAQRDAVADFDSRRIFDAHDAVEAEILLNRFVFVHIGEHREGGMVRTVVAAQRAFFGLSCQRQAAQTASRHLLEMLQAALTHRFGQRHHAAVLGTQPATALQQQLRRALHEQLVRYRLSLSISAFLARLLAWRPAPTSICAFSRTPDSRSPRRASPRDRCSAA